MKAALAAVAVALGLSGPVAAQGQSAPPMKVGVVEMKRQQIPRVVSLPGRAVAYQEVDLRPRIGGVIQEILYTPGQDLKVGDPLFRIDDAAYRAQVAADQAEVSTAEAELQVAQSTYERVEQLAGRGFTVAEAEAATGKLAGAKAALEGAKAALEFSQTQLSWTTITSPIEGSADVATVSVGDLVTAGQSDALTTITRLDPIDVDMLEASARMLQLRQQIEDGTLSVNAELNAKLTLENGQIYRGVGQFVTPGNAVSTSTGTLTLRFRFDNPDRLILPGMFMRGDITMGTMNAYLVPQRAATRNNAGKLVTYFVGQDGMARQVLLSDIGSYQNNWIVLADVEDGAQLIVDGQKSLRPGLPVTPVPVRIGPDGLVRDAAEGGQDAAQPAGD